MWQKKIAVLASFLLALSALAADPFKWTKVGGDPCNPKAGCTLEWALGKTGWSQEVQLGLIAKVKGSAPDTIAITSGLAGAKDPAWRGWMTWGKYSPKFEARVVAGWSDGQYHPASHWSLVKGDMLYHLIKVRACGNWGGWTEVVPLAPVAVAQEPVVSVTTSGPPEKRVPIVVFNPRLAEAPQPQEMQLGIPPVVTCPE